MKILCVDPGITGGICILDTNTKEAQFYPMPIVTHRGKNIVNVKKLFDIISIDKYDIVGMEQVHAMPGQGVSSTFSFGFTTGIIYAMLELYFTVSSTPLLFEDFTPQSWKKFATLLGSPKEEVLTKITGSTLVELNKLKSKVHRIACAEAYMMCKYMESKHRRDYEKN